MQHKRHSAQPHMWLLKGIKPQHGSLLLLINSESEYSENANIETPWCFFTRHLNVSGEVRPRQSDILKTLHQNLQPEASCCFSPISSAASKDAAALDLPVGCQAVVFLFSLQRCIYGSSSRSKNKPGEL